MKSGGPPTTRPAVSKEMHVNEQSSSHGPIYKSLNAVAYGSLCIAGVQLVILIVIFGWLVYGRYILNDTPTWVEQLSLLLVVWITFLGAGAGVWYKGHLSIDFIREAFPDVLRVPMRWLAVIGVLVFGGFLAWQGYTLAMKTWPRIIPMLGVNEGWRAVPMAICGVQVVVFSIYHLGELARGEFKLAGER